MAPSAAGPRAAPPVIAWWGIFPAALFAIAHVYLKWNTAKSRTSDAGGAIGFLFGGLIGGFLVAIAASWIAYRIWKKSKTAGSITFAAALLCLISAESSSLGRAPATVRPASSAATPAAFGEFAFEIPVGWAQLRSDREKTKAMLALHSNDPGTADGLIMVDVGRPTLKSATEIARSMAGSDGQVLPDTVQVDGADGIRVETSSPDTSRPRHVVVVLRDGRLYLIMAARAHGTDVSSAFEHILRTWHWADHGP